MKNFRIFAILCIGNVSLFLTGCFGGRPTGYFQEESAITTRGGFGENGVFHDIIYNPEAIALNFPGYIVGLDKGRRHAVGNGVIYPDSNLEDQRGMRNIKERMRSDPKIHYISHVVRDEGKPYGQDNCLIYTMYSQWGSSKINAGDAPAKMCFKDQANTGKSQTAQVDSYKALDLLTTELQQTIKDKKSKDGHGYTHVIVASMGWNTPQIKAIQNFNSIVPHLKNAAGKSRFEPLFIGVTWPSVWSSQWLDPLIKFASYKAKANDADEVGTIWISEIIDRIKFVAPPETMLVGIGHSFGARAMFSAICGESISGKARLSKRKWNTLIGWQSAFSINRFTENGSGDGFSYSKGCLDKVDTIVLTASEYDTAVNSAFWADMAGSRDQWKEVCSGLLKEGNKIKINGKVNCITSDPDKKSESESEIDIKRGYINYVDASKIVLLSQPNTGGGAHNDIYRAVHGKLNWKAISIPPN
ncbi:hypothetical protein RCH06_003459 [Polaromonas sp. CG_9.5]|uniref:hypothetical protein n=1 Tax=Polaromonas sp. CG_9.5 TaxID=3071705 RepID=UPI002E07035C|nr:hypothetical protein [Polaromonas sp. CG_9.5]